MNLKQNIITVIICVGLLVASGCTNFDWDAFGRGLSEYSHQQQQSNYQQQMLYELNSINIGLENLRQQKVLILPPARPMPRY